MMKYIKKLANKNEEVMEFEFYRLSLSEKKQKQYKFALQLFEEKTFLKNSVFTKAMKKEGYSHSISQSILKKLLDDRVIQKEAIIGYTLHDTNRFTELTENIDGFLKS